MNRRVMAASLAALVFAGAAPAEYTGPKNPDEPVIGTPSGTGRDGKGGVTEYEVTVVTAQGERVSGFLLAGAAVIEAEVAEKGGITIKSIPLSGIASVEILRWRGKRLRKEEYVFRPAHFRITLADKTVYECSNDIKIFAKMRIRSLKRVRAVYAYYYDYRELNRWKNSGKEDMRYPETNPHGDTAVRILFTHQEPNLLERLLGK